MTNANTQNNKYDYTKEQIRIRKRINTQKN